MDFQSIRDYCLALPGAVEDVKWEGDLTFLIETKIFAIIGIHNQAPRAVTLKVPKPEYERLIAIEGVEPAPYLARYHWVAIRQPKRFPPDWIQTMLDQSYDLILSKLPKRVQKRIRSGPIDPQG